jgi:hypothetical protein
VTDTTPKDYVGSKCRIVHCEDALKSYLSAIQGVPCGKRSRSFTRSMMLQIERLADGQRMSKENFPQEGLLPAQAGPGKNFNALKKIPIRGYCWKSSRYPNTYFISHYIFKTCDKLKDKDTKLVGRNWTRIEVDGYEK